MEPKLERSVSYSSKKIDTGPGLGLCDPAGDKSPNAQPEKRRERRKHPRVFLDLPIEYRVMGDPKAHGALVANGSEMGLLIRSVKDIPVGTNLNLAVLFPKGYEMVNFDVSAQIVWKEMDWREDWRGYKYGLKFVSIRTDDHRKLRELLSGRFNAAEIGRDL